MLAILIMLFFYVFFKIVNKTLANRNSYDL